MRPGSSKVRDFDLRNRYTEEPDWDCFKRPAAEVRCGDMGDTEDSTARALAACKCDVRVEQVCGHHYGRIRVIIGDRSASKFRPDMQDVVVGQSLSENLAESDVPALSKRLSEK